MTRLPELMGILNVTPDSFYPGSRVSADDAAARGLKLVEEGASWIDVGGQSTRPGSDVVSLDEECARVLPVIEALAKRLPRGVRLSIDTEKAEVARRALDAGATVVNDVNGLQAPGMMSAALKAEKVVIMHRQGDSKTMQDAPTYRNVVSEVIDFLRERKAAFLAAGGRAEQVLVDPGVGFGKTLEHNLSLIKHAEDLAQVAPVLLGVSRKSMFSKLHADAGPQDRLAGSLAVAAFAARAGVAVLRVHDVLETRRLLETLKAVAEAA